ncbi:MAG TPA: TRAM domain-containing protein, partial [Candidatus Cloacimonadota bacterium]|nr:TRAM domain-containing protein [Candidatus Cloacimonadota bacterium]
QAKIGSVVDIYVESLSKKSELDVSGKTDDYKIAVVKGEAGMIGSFVQARVVTATAGTLICEPIIDN